MKILKNKTYQGMVEKVEKITEENKKLKDAQFGWVKMNDNLKKRLEKKETKIGELEVKIASCKTKNMQLEDENRQLKEENKKLLAAKGELEKQVEELEFKLKESMTDKYLVKKIPSGRRPKAQPMKIKDWSKISNISRKVFGGKNE